MRTAGRFLLIVIAVASSAGVALSAPALPAFPGAEGFGSTTPGGRGGKVLIVRNLDDAGPGSFREACAVQGPRIIVFSVGGYITLQSDVPIKHPFCTIAGQTAPGGGICIRGGGVVITTHDVVIRHVRFRMGRLPAEQVDHFRDCIDIVGKPPSHHIVLDHCSIGWAVSRNVVTWNDAHDLTVQWCIISEGLRGPEASGRSYGGMGFLIGDRTHDISVHHCLFAHNYQRNPRLKHGVRADLVNNVVYNWSDSGAHLIGDFERHRDAPPVQANVINNWYQAGHDTQVETPVIRVLTSATLHTAGNVSNHRWYMADLTESVRWLTLSDVSFAAAPVTTLSARQARERVLSEAGATRPRRDAVDERVVREVRDGAGWMIDDPERAGGWPVLESGTPPADADADAMPDTWESRHRLDPSQPGDAGRDADGDGYTNVEEYLNETDPHAPDWFTAPPRSRSSPGGA